MGLTRLDLADGVATLTLQRSGRANALSAELVDSVSEDVGSAVAAGCSVLVLRSAEPQFCGGFDLADLATTTSAELSLRFLRVGLLLERVQTAPLLTLAAVDGAAIGAGADLVAACDVRIGTARARMRFPGSRFGVVLGTRRLAALVGEAVALRLTATGTTVEADEAHALGLLDEVVTADALDDALDRVARGAAGRAPSVLAGLRSAACTGSDPAGVAELARSLAAAPDLHTALTRYASTPRKEAS